MYSNKSPVEQVNLSVERMTNPPSLERDSETPKQQLNTIQYSNYKPKLPRNIEKSRNFTSINADTNPTTSSLSPQRLIDLQQLVSPRNYVKKHF